MTHSADDKSFHTCRLADPNRCQRVLAHRRRGDGAPQQAHRVVHGGGGPGQAGQGAGAGFQHPIEGMRAAEHGLDHWYDTHQLIAFIF